MVASATKLVAVEGGHYFTQGTLPGASNSIHPDSTNLICSQALILLKSLSHLLMQALSPLDASIQGVRCRKCNTDIGDYCINVFPLTPILQGSLMVDIIDLLAHLSAWY